MRSAPVDVAGDHRLFFALWPEARVRDALVQAVDGAASLRDRGRRVSPAKLHLTLHYLGAWPAWPEDVARRARAAAAAVACPRFDLVVERAGGFAGARVGWLAPRHAPPLVALWEKLRTALDAAAVSYRSHDRFAPHITVLRDVRGPLADGSIPAIHWPVAGFVLVHGHAGRYDVVAQWSLA